MGWNNSADARPRSSTLLHAVSSAASRASACVAHRGLDQNRLAQLGFPQLGFDLGGRLLDAAAAAGVAWIWLQQALAAHGKTGDFSKVAPRHPVLLPSRTTKDDGPVRPARQRRPNHNRSGRKLVLAWRMHGPDATPGRSIRSATSPLGCPHRQADSSPWRIHLNR